MSVEGSPALQWHASKHSRSTLRFEGHAGWALEEALIEWSAEEAGLPIRLSPGLLPIARTLRDWVGVEALLACLAHQGPGRLLQLVYGWEGMCDLPTFAEVLRKTWDKDLNAVPPPLPLPAARRRLLRPGTPGAGPEDYVRVDLQLPSRLDPDDPKLWRWLWSWIWPRTWGDTWRDPPSLTGGMPPTESCLGLLSPSVSQAEGAPPLVFFEGLEAPSWSGSWLVSVEGAAPARVELVDTPKGLLIRIDLHPWVYARAGGREALISLLAMARELGLEVSVGPPALAREVARVDRATLREALNVLLGLLPELEWVASGALVPPGVSGWARLLVNALAPGSRWNRARATKDWSELERATDGDHVLDRLEGAFENASARRPRPSADPHRVKSAGGPSYSILRDYIWGDLPGVACAQLADGTWRQESGSIRDCAARLRSWAEDGGLRLGAVCPGSPDAVASVLSEGLPSLASRAGLLLIGAEHLNEPVSLRALHHGPFHQESLSHNRVLVQFAHLDAPQLAARWQILSQLVSRDSLFAPRVAELPADLAEYDADTRTVLVRPAHVPDLYRKLAAVVGWSRARASSPTQPVERVLAAISDPTLARLWLPVLWLREIAVWTVEDGRWTRVDETYTPSWEPPPWVSWEPAKPAPIGG